MKLDLFFKVTRINFLPASIVPFLTGMVLAFREGAPLSSVKLIAGLLGIASAHLAGNLFNDYFDHKSGADTVTGRRSPFFGGSGVVQQGLVSAGKVFFLGFGFLLVSLMCGLLIFIITQDPVFLFMMGLAGVLTVGYTAPPLRLAYRRLGELDIFFLFGVFMVMASFYLFAGRFSAYSFFAALPVSFLIGAVIVCNEVPDAQTDIKARKYNLVSIFSEKNRYILYSVVVTLSYFAILVNVGRGLVSPLAAGLAVFYLMGFKAARLLKNGLGNFGDLVKASAFTIVLHAVIGVGMVVAILLR
jgi:1,4-dihydroxy-2-naphthoate octaprenyltransferase